MKKGIASLISIFTFICVLVNLSGITAYASIVRDENSVILQTMESLSKFSLSRCTRSEVYGLCGKDESEKSVCFSSEPDSTDSTWYVSTSWNHTGYDKYLVIEANVLFDENVTTFFVGTRTHAALSGTIRANAEFVSNQWGKLLVIYNAETNCTDTYFDNQLVSSNLNTVFNTMVGGRLYSEIRFVFGGANTGSGYVSDYMLYETDNPPVVTNDLYIDEFKDSASVLVREGTTCSEFTVIGDPDEIKIYSDDSYTNMIGMDDELTEGCKIVIKKGTDYRIYTVNVDYGIDVEDENADGTIPFQRAEITEEQGLFGKNSGDVSQKITADSAIPCFSTYTWLNDDFVGYVRADFNIEPGNMNQIYIGTNVHLPVSEPLSLNANQWNRVTVIYSTESYDAVTGKGRADTYVNGVKVSSVDTIFTHCGQMRVIMTGKSGSYAYLDDFKFSTFRYGAPEVPLGDELSDNIEIINGYLMPEEGMTVSQLTAKTPTSSVRAFSDATCKYELGGDDEISIGNIIVTETEDNVYKYYTAYGSNNISVIRDTTDLSAPFTVTRGSAEEVSGIGGKAESDKSIKITQTSAEELTCFNDTTWKHENFEGYLTAELNIYPVSATPSVATNGHVPLTSGISNLPEGRWSKVVVIYDAVKKCTYLYVNGEYIGVKNIELKSGSVVRIIAYSNAGLGGYMYIDDYKIYESDVLPVVSVPDVSKRYQTGDGFVILEHDAVPADLSVERLTLRVYTDSSFSTLVQEDEQIVPGCVLVAEDVNKTLTYYNIINDIGKTVLVGFNGGTLADGINAVDGTVSSENGAKGREPGDESVVLTVNSSASTLNGYINYKYSADSDKRYVVYEISAYPENDGSIKFATNSHNSISPVVYVNDGSGVKEQWNRFVLIVDKQKARATLYVNGDEKGTVEIGGFVSGNAPDARFVYFAENGSRIYLDDAEIYECDVKPTVAKAAVIPQSVKYILFNSDLYMSSDVRYSEIASTFGIDDAETSIKIYKDGSSVDIGADNGTVPDGAVMTFTRENNLYSSYSVHLTQQNEAFFYGPMGKSGVLSDGVLRVAVPVEDVASLPAVTIALYKDGKLVLLTQPSVQGYSKFITYDLDVRTADCDTVKVFVWKNSNLMPYSKAAVIAG